MREGWAPLPCANPDSARHRIRPSIRAGRRTASRVTPRDPRSDATVRLAKKTSNLFRARAQRRAPARLLPRLRLGRSHLGRSKKTWHRRDVAGTVHLRSSSPGGRHPAVRAGAAGGSANSRRSHSAARSTAPGIEPLDVVRNGSPRLRPRDRRRSAVGDIVTATPEGEQPTCSGVPQLLRNPRRILHPAAHLQLRALSNGMWHCAHLRFDSLDELQSAMDRIWSPSVSTTANPVSTTWTGVVLPPRPRVT